MDNQIAQRIKEIIATNQHIAIVVGKNPTLDDMGAALALYLALTSSNKQVSIASPTQPIVEISSLVGIDKVRTNLDGNGNDLVVSFPYQEGEIEKVSYTLEGGFLNIIVKAGENGLSFNEQDIRYRRGGGTVPVLFVIGTPRLSDLGNLFDQQALKDTTIINIDNKQENQGFGEVTLVSPDFSSVSEQVAELITALNLPLNTDSAQNLLSGISFATNNFQSPNTSSFAFEIAAILMRKGARRISQQTPDRLFAPPGQQTQRQQQPDRQRGQMPQRGPRQFGRNIPQQQQQHRQQQQNQRPPIHQQEKQQQQAQQMNQQQENDNQETPPDWLTPKVYRGSSSI